MFARDIYTLMDIGQQRVCLDSWEFDIVKICFIQLISDLVEYAVVFCRAITVYEQCSVAEWTDLSAQVTDSILPKNDLDRIVKDKVMHLMPEIARKQRLVLQTPELLIVRHEFEDQSYCQIISAGLISLSGPDPSVKCKGIVTDYLSCSVWFFFDC